jgi:electron transfer flavoprotein alpha/beta subunit
MKIVCLVKQVPAIGAIEFDEEAKTLKREGVPLELNVFDRYAVQHAAALGEEVVAMTMGPPQAEEALRECLALGADRAILLSDRVFAVADTLGTSRTLALAIRREGADVVLCGRKTTDSETWQVPPEVAAFLGWPHLTSVVAIEPGLRVTRETDEGEEIYEVEPPVVLSVAEPPGGEPVAKEGRIDVWQASDLVSDLHPNDKRFGQTGSPTRVLAVRDSRPERKGLRAETADEAARMVGEVLAERAPEPPSWEKPGHIAEVPGASYDCWSVVELLEGRPRRISLELLARARELAGKLGGQNTALVIGDGLEEAIAEVARHGAEVVYAADDAMFAEYHPELWAAVVRQVLAEQTPRVLLIPATTQGRDYGPRAAGELELGMTGDCVGVDIVKAGRLLQQKPAYGGNIVSVIMGSTTPQLATVRPRMYEPLEPREDAQAEVEEVEAGRQPVPRLKLVERRSSDGGGALDEADVVVCVGPDLDVAEVGRVASRAGVAVGGSQHSAVPRRRKIGLLGRPVAPRLYVAIGVEDEPEHWAGCVKAAVIVSVGDSVPEAADVAVAGDWSDVLPSLLDAALEKR